MNKSILTIVMAMLIISAVSLVSAKTLIAGKIYDISSGNMNTVITVADANVSVNCTHDSVVYTVSATSLSDGTYAVSFMNNETDVECDVGDMVVVSAVKGDLHGMNNGTVWDGSRFDIPCDLAVINVPLVPEFGLIVGGLTVASAIVLFFVVRRK